METTGPHQPRSVEDRVRAHFADLDRREAPVSVPDPRRVMQGRPAVTRRPSRRLLLATVGGTAATSLPSGPPVSTAPPRTPGVGAAGTSLAIADGGVLGWWDGHAWHNAPAGSQVPVTGGERYLFVHLGDPVRTATGGAPVPGCDPGLCDPPAFWRLSRAHVTGRDARIVGMSTRRLIIAALVCGLAILVAFAVQVWLVL